MWNKASTCNHHRTIENNLLLPKENKKTFTETTQQKHEEEFNFLENEQHGLSLQFSMQVLDICTCFLFLLKIIHLSGIMLCTIAQMLSKKLKEIVYKMKESKNVTLFCLHRQLTHTSPYIQIIRDFTIICFFQ